MWSLITVPNAVVARSSASRRDAATRSMVARVVMAVVMAAVMSPQPSESETMSQMNSAHPYYADGPGGHPHVRDPRDHALVQRDRQAAVPDPARRDAAAAAARARAGCQPRRSPAAAARADRRRRRHARA